MSDMTDWEENPIEDFGERERENHYVHAEQSTQQLRAELVAAQARIAELESLADKLMEERNALANKKDFALMTIESREARIAALTAVVERVEFSSPTDDCYCMWCRWHFDMGHAPGCPRQAALGNKAGE